MSLLGNRYQQEEAQLLRQGACWRVVCPIDTEKLADADH